MTDEQHTNQQAEPVHGVADQMVEEAARRYKDIPKTDDLKRFSLGKLFEGRIDRENYIYGLIASVILGVILMFIPVIGWVLGLALALVGLGVVARRLHDIAQTGWIALIAFVPLVGFLLAVYLAFAKTVDEGNPYGPKPDPKRGFYHVMLNI